MGLLDTLDQFTREPADPADNPDASLVARRPVDSDTEMDISPMIDCVFLLLIFFIVTSMPDAQAALDLAPARHGIGVSQRGAIFISVADRDGQAADVYLSDGKNVAPLDGTPPQIETQVREWVEQGLSDGKNNVIIKAERGVRHRHVARIAAAASLEGVKLNLAVMEID